MDEMRLCRLLVVVSGPPASGKTTVSRALAEALGIPHVARDAIKENLFDTLGTGDREWSRQLGRASWSLLLRVMDWVLATGGPALVENNFLPDAGDEIRQYLRDHRYRAVEVVCEAPTDVLLERFRNRAQDGSRHPGHVDHIPARLEEFRLSLERRPAAIGGLGLGPVQIVDTSRPVDIGALVAWVRQQAQSEPVP
jgi:predicted kinase